MIYKDFVEMRKMSKIKLGFMQGRLSPKVNNQIQSLPLEIVCLIFFIGMLYFSSIITIKSRSDTPGAVTVPYSTIHFTDFKSFSELTN